ncbi:hypothetical protein [Pseudomonas sp. G5(2012)]|uniref:hypothetical protein n=1 Tax=Pseudomonas sp. G5(2012) TaxID=1268068 RepID=UPI0012DD0408|nr:hypothetical protein [Pseudomonas sp. G5(2012)]
MKSLCFVARPNFEENPGSILMRTASLNGYSSVSRMARELTIAYFDSSLSLTNPDGALYALLCNECPDLASELKASAYTLLNKLARYEGKVLISGLVLPWTALRQKQVYCPKCLKERQMKFIQDIDGVHACPYHGTEYLSVCPACERRFKWQQVEDGHCLCGFDFRESPCTQSEDLTGLKLLNIFRTRDQSTLNRTYAALKCLRYRYLTSSRRSIVLNMALRIGAQDEQFFYDVLSQDLENHKQLPQKAITIPWLLSDDKWIIAITKKFNAENTWERTICTTPNCCAGFGLSANEFYHITSAYKGTLTIAVNTGKIKIQQLGIFFYYISGQMCKIITPYINRSEYISIRKNFERRKYYSMREIEKALHISIKTANQLTNLGFFGQVISTRPRWLFVKRTAVEKFNKKYISGTALASSLHITSFTLHNILAALEIKHIELPPPPHSDPHPHTRLYLRSSITKIKKLLTMKTTTTPYIHPIPQSLAPTIATELNLPIPTTKHLLNNPKYFIRDINMILNLDSAKQTRALVTELKIWRKNHFTRQESAELAHISYSDFNLRFGKSQSIQSTKVHSEYFFNRKALKAIILETKNYITRRQVLNLANLSASMLRRLVRLGIIRCRVPTNKNSARAISLYCTADILAYIENPYRTNTSLTPLTPITRTTPTHN